MNSRQYLPIIALIAFFALLFGCGNNNGEDNGKSVSSQEFTKSLAFSEKVAIIEDIRGATSVGKVSVMQCGVELAGSEGLVGKNISIFAFDLDNKCIGNNRTDLSISECYNLAKGGAVLQVKYGPENASFYENKLVIFVNENTATECRINVLNSTQASS